VTKSLLLLLTLGTLTSARAQGTVFFGNASTTSGWGNPFLDRNVRFGPSAAAYNPLLIAGDNVSSNYAGLDLSGLRAALYYGSGSDLASFTKAILPNSAIGRTFKASTSTTAGSWFGAEATLQTVAWGVHTSLAVVIWDSSLSTDPFSAEAKTGLWGASSIFSYVPPIAGPPSSWLMENYESFTIGIPEPSVPALFGLAAVIAWWRRELTKRKQRASGAAVVLKSLLLLLTLGTLSSARAQGILFFANASTTTGLTPADRTVRWANNATSYNPSLQPGGLVSSNYAGLDFSFLRAAACYSATATTNLADFTVAVGTVTTFRQSTSTTVGSWFNKADSNVSAYPDAYVFAVVWDIRLSSDPLSPEAQAGLWGKSDPFWQYTGFLGPPDSGHPQDLRSFTIGIPEPSAPALFGLAAVIAWWRRETSRKRIRQD